MYSQQTTNVKKHSPIKLMYISHNKEKDTAQVTIKFHNILNLAVTEVKMLNRLSILGTYSEIDTYTAAVMWELPMITVPWLIENYSRRPDIPYFVENYFTRLKPEDLTELLGF